MSFIKSNNEKFEVEIKYKDKEMAWNNLISYIISFIVDSNLIKEALKDNNGEVNE